MFGLSFSEIFLIMIIILILFGNKNLPHNIKKFFLYYHKTKKNIYNVQNTLNNLRLDLKHEVEEHLEKNEIIKNAEVKQIDKNQLKDIV